MTLEDIYYISQIAAVIAIFASLIFVGIQVRQNSEQIKANTRSIKASAGFDATHSWATFNEQLFGMSDEILLLIPKVYDPAKSWDDFTEVERVRVTCGQRALFQKLEGMYFLYRYGSLDKAIWESRRDWAAGAIKSPFFQRWWESEKSQSIYSAEFINVIEAARDGSAVVPWDPSALRGHDGLHDEANPQAGAPKS
jgi:hypothetical protein